VQPEAKHNSAAHLLAPDIRITRLLFSFLPCCFLAAILYLIQDSSKEAAGKKGNILTLALFLFLLQISGNWISPMPLARQLYRSSYD
jgi:Zn-dependent protease with chaperone function